MDEQSLILKGDKAQETYSAEQYLQLKEEYESYHNMAVITINDLKGKNAEWEKKHTDLTAIYDSYQSMAEMTMQNISFKNMELEKKLDALANINEIGKYINLYMSDDNLLTLINDMMLGIIGVTYSTIYLMDKEKLTVKASNIGLDSYSFIEKSNLIKINNNNAFVLNNDVPLYAKKGDNEEIHSMVGVPILLRDKFLGYIILEHSRTDFFNKEHIKFLSSITNQIAVVLENSLLYKMVKESAIRDPLLGIYNRKHFFNTVSKKIESNPEDPFAIVMLDIDNFKKCNDVYGHPFGDEVLKQTAKLIEDSIGENDIVARYGGEEIVIYVDKADDPKAVYEKIDAIRYNISQNTITFGEITSYVTGSLGISFYPANATKIEEVLNIADTHLYEAKHTGKNKVVSAL